MKKIMKYDFLKSLIKKSPMLRRTLRPLKDIIRKDVVSPKFSGWGMTSIHELPWIDDFQGDAFRKASFDLNKVMKFDRKKFGYYYSHTEELLWRHWNIAYAVNWMSRFTQVNEYNFVECGVGQGFSTFFAMREASSIPKIGSNFSMHLYDSWKAKIGRAHV